MNTRNSKWTRFTKSGRVNDYLEYKASLRTEAAQEEADFDVLEDNDEPEYRRAGNKGKPDGRE